MPFEHATKHDIDFSEARRLLKHICSNSHTLQTFSDQDAHKKVDADSGRKFDPHAKQFFESSELNMFQLAKMNKAGAGVYFMVNEGNGKGRKNENVTAINALFVDLDGAPIEPVLKAGLTPHAIVESSPGRYHAYFKVTDCQLHDFKKLQQELAAKFNGDRSVNDLARVMRLPGFLHNKKEPFLTQILEINDHPAYSVAEIVSQLSLDLNTSDSTKPKQSQRHEYKVDFDLQKWAADYGSRFEIVNALKARSPRVFTGLVRDGKHHIECINAAAHSTSHADDGTFIINASESGNQGFVYHCMHSHCVDHDRLFFLQKMLAAGWLNESDLTNYDFIAGASRLVSMDFHELLRAEIPPKEYWLDPIFIRAGLNQIYGNRGIGKTFFTGGILYALSTGTNFLKYKATRPVKCLYVDGEMQAFAIQDRFKQLFQNHAVQPQSGYLRIINPDFQKHGLMPDLATREGQQQMDDAIGDAEFVVIDNISALVRTGDENNAQDWIPAQTWSLKHRAAGRSITWIHHDNKAGGQRGTSKREDPLDTVINLRRPKDYQQSQGARFEIHLEKARHCHGEEVAPFEAMVIPAAHGEGLEWVYKSMSSSNYEQCVDLFNLGLSQGDIAKELNLNKSNVCRHLKQARVDGRLNRKSD